MSSQMPLWLLWSQSSVCLWLLPTGQAGRADMKSQAAQFLCSRSHTASLSPTVAGETSYRDKGRDGRLHPLLLHSPVPEDLQPPRGQCSAPPPSACLVGTVCPGMFTFLLFRMHLDCVLVCFHGCRCLRRPKLSGFLELQLGSGKPPDSLAR